MLVEGKHFSIITSAGVSILSHTLPEPAAKQCLMDCSINTRKKYCFSLLWYACMNEFVNTE